MHFDISVILSLCSLIGVIITIVSFFNRLKWDNAKHTNDLEKQAKDINNLGAKVERIRDQFTEEQRVFIEKITVIEKQVLEMQISLEHVRTVLSKIEEKLS